MVAVNARDADRLVAEPPAGIGAYLVYGPDEGLVAERAARIAAATADPADPFSLIRMEAAAVSADPARLADEAYAVSMFGGRRAIHLRDAGSRAGIAAILAPLLASPPPETTLVVEAGNLQKSNPLRTLFERDRVARAIPCYADDQRTLAALVDEEVRAHGLAISAPARSMLVSHLGGDRLLSRAEIRKLCLYALSTGTIGVDDVLATVVDAGAIAVDDIVDATATGDMAGLVTALRRAAREGLEAGMIAGAVLRHFQALELARAQVDAGKSPHEAMEQMRPPVFFKRRDAVIRAIAAWTSGEIVRVQARLAVTARDARLGGALGHDILGEALLAMAGWAARRR
jgi:DNA polymerase-3 subunit delta